MNEKRRERGYLVAQRDGACKPQDVVPVMASFHSSLQTVLGKHCRVHGLFNGRDNQHQDFGVLADADARFFEELLQRFPHRGQQSYLNSILTYETRNRVCQGHFLFDHIISGVHLSLTMPDPAHPFHRKQIIDLARTLVDSLAPDRLIYHDADLIDALTAKRPPPPEPDIPGTVSLGPSDPFNAKWITYNRRLASASGLRFPTLDAIETKHGPMFIAKPNYFGTVDDHMLKDIIRLSDIIKTARTCPPNAPTRTK